MPLYEFECTSCGNVFEELFHPIDKKESLNTHCPKCGKMAKKVLSSYHFIIKGYNAENGYSKKKGKT